MKDIKLDVCGGCNAKIPPASLDEILNSIVNYKRKDILVGYDSKDDSAVINIDDKTGIITSLDFFPPMVSDPFVFGQIAAANALSDIYAMGAEAICALNIVAFPENGDIGALEKILQGGASKVTEAKASLVGGHSIHDPKVKYGLSVIGKCPIDKIWKNNTPKIGHKLILTKPLGVTLVVNAHSLGLVSDEDFDLAINSMTTLNKYAKDILQKYKISSATDVTGFSLLGHLGEMVDKNFTAILDSSQIPLLKGARKAASEFVFTKGGERNRLFMEKKVEFQVDDFPLEEILYDPQTSGGLLVAIDPNDADKALEELRVNNIESSIIGEIYKKFDKSIFIV
ncbi:MAG: selenide, water dikinase SelD [Peptoniphilaceae bacterium]|nr:selenide, water dikinase SelD [Peptoniphilaceae bacterium]MDY6018742.1 selenide, water dikinase SelD [Anaerococcus sp.]